jgi:transcriptional regulator with XRE-family HTH domain
MTMKELSNKLHLSESVISLYESGRRQPSYDVLDKMAHIWGVTVDYLLGRTDNRNESANIHEKIRCRRIELGLSLEDVASSIGVSADIVDQYETQAAEISLEKVDALCRALNTTPLEMIGWDIHSLKVNDEEIAEEKKILIDMINNLSDEDRKFAISLLARLSNKE